MRLLSCNILCGLTVRNVLGLLSNGWLLVVAEATGKGRLPAGRRVRRNLASSTVAPTTTNATTSTTTVPTTTTKDTIAGADYFQASPRPFAGSIATKDVPQFILLTVDGSVTYDAVNTFRPLSSVYDSRECAVRATWYISIGSASDPILTKCDAVQALLQASHEIATHTVNHVGDPSVEEIKGAVKWLHQECGVPLEEMRGFRTPYLAHTQDTFDRLHELGFLYDSSITEHRPAANGGTNYIWPYTMDEGISQSCAAAVGTCDRTKSNPGLFEIPMWILYDENGNALPEMDFPSNNVYDTLDINLDRRYNGNRAPLGIFVHSWWLKENINHVTRWAQGVLGKYNDVFFVTNYELIEYMRNPVPKQEYNRSCAAAAQVSADDCFPPPGHGCLYGTFNPSTCLCDCVDPWSRNEDGVCFEISHDPVDGGWSNFSSYRPCCDGIKTRSRTCTNPEPTNGGADCVGEAVQQQDCPDTGRCEEPFYYPDYTAQQCLADGNEPEWMDLSTIQECCEVNFNWEPVSSHCLGEVHYYPSWAQGRCIADGQAPIWMKLSSLEQCCQENFYWDPTCLVELGNSTDTDSESGGNAPEADSSSSLRALSPILVLAQTMPLFAVLSLI